VNQGRTRSIETAGTRSGWSIAVVASVEPALEPDEALESVVGSEAVPVVAPGSAGTAWQALALASSLVFDQMTELLENDLLVASWNS